MSKELPEGTIPENKQKDRLYHADARLDTVTVGGKKNVRHVHEISWNSQCTVVFHGSGKQSHSMARTSQ